MNDTETKIKEKKQTVISNKIPDFNLRTLVTIICVGAIGVIPVLIFQILDIQYDLWGMFISVWLIHQVVLSNRVTRFCDRIFN